MLVDGSGKKTLRRLSDAGVLLNARTLSDTMQLTYTFHPSQVDWIVETHHSLMSADINGATLAHAARIVSQETAESKAKLDGLRENWVALQQTLYESPQFAHDGFGYDVATWTAEARSAVLLLAETIKLSTPTVVGCGNFAAEVLAYPFGSETSPTRSGVAEHRAPELNAPEEGRFHGQRSRHLLGIPINFNVLGDASYLATWCVVEALRHILNLENREADVSLGIFGPFGLLRSDCISIVYRPPEADGLKDQETIKNAVKASQRLLESREDFNKIQAKVTERLRAMLISPDQQSSIAGKLALAGEADLSSIHANLASLSQEEVVRNAVNLHALPVFTVPEMMLK
ncbi:hypothetical protein QNO08_17200 (plasmid) [Arthrobacter sp. zg-Y820]|uniref:hypothetical protein n=1 Tax=unclassified Arthrobacter TaxID=235627 RepID=UPI001E471406|nr:MULTISPECIES: hypothetical protein [unclassified Arthrobacter]MCC9198534.1 hypothetical protein [Arthrobacter sp. zg-Y820]MDK1281404.1 hypothetical protein [Arthrobacter sp. zg.Y820]WIB11252.1 hypothetical protein QNO08_17200 [Arthrobacter sp. zg-Y820]